MAKLNPMVESMVLVLVVGNARGGGLPCYVVYPVVGGFYSS
jgi:hypothetical protein